MLQTISPYNSPNNAKTAQIMARYRPIAPRPDLPAENQPLARVSSHLHARPSRTRKRGRTSFGPPFSGKRLRSSYLQGLLSPPNYQFPPPIPTPPRPFYASPVNSIAGLGTRFSNPTTTPVKIPILAHSPEKGVIDLNKSVDLEEKDLLQQFESPTTVTVIKPKPVRLVRSMITVWSIKEEPKPKSGPSNPVMGNNLEEEVESKIEPVVVTDSKNRIRVVNSAYKELVGQPESLWVETVGRCNGEHIGTACKRICGEVMLRVMNSGLPVPIVSNGFSGQAQIEWESTGNKRFVDLLFDATKLYCESKDYQFAWRFYNPEALKSGYQV